MTQRARGIRDENQSKTGAGQCRLWGLVGARFKSWLFLRPLYLVLEEFRFYHLIMRKLKGAHGGSTRSDGKQNQGGTQ